GWSPRPLHVSSAPAPDPARPAPVRPAASVLLLRPGAPAPIEGSMIRRHQSRRCRGLAADAVEEIFPGKEGVPALAYWVTAARELLEETGLLVATDRDGGPISTADPPAAPIVPR